MKVNIKSYILLLSAALFCLTTSCSGKNSGDKDKGEVSTMLEAIELGADPQKMKATETATEATQSEATQSEATPSKANPSELTGELEVNRHR